MNDVNVSLNIQAIWLIEEKVIIFRNLVWLNLSVVLTINEIIILIIVKNIKGLLFIIRIMGAIFCHVSKIEQFIHERPSMTSANQKWNGAAPSFVNNAEFNIIKNDEFIWVGINSLVNNIIVIENRRIKDAIAWVIKYLSDDSDEYIFLVDENNGIIESKLISRPIHIPIQVYDEIEINVPTIIILKKIILYSFKIKKRKFIFHSQGMNLKALLAYLFMF